MKVSPNAIIQFLLSMLGISLGVGYGSLVSRIDQNRTDLVAGFARIGVLEVQHADTQAKVGAACDRITKTEGSIDKLDERERGFEASMRK